MKSVRARLMAAMASIVFTSLFIVATLAAYLNYVTAEGVLEQNMLETAKVAASNIYNQLRFYKNVAENAGRDIRLHDGYSIEEKQAVLDEVVASYPDFTRGNVLDANGISIFTGDSYADREYFQKSMAGASWVSEPLVSRVTGQLSLIVSAPIKDFGTNSIIGVVYFVPKETFLNDIVTSIKISPGAGAYVLNKKATVIAHPDIELVKEQSNSQENEKTDSKLAKIASLEREMIAGRAGFGSYEFDGEKKFLGYAPIPNTDGWSFGVNTPINDFLSYTFRSIRLSITLTIVFLIIAIVLSVLLANGIGNPLGTLSSVLSSIANTGKIELGQEFEQNKDAYLARKDEIGRITGAVLGLVEMLRDVSTALNKIADGDLTIDVSQRSEQDALNKSMKKMTEHLNEMFLQINDVSGQVASGASHIAGGSQALAQGSTEQAASIEQLSASISNVSEQTAKNADRAREAADLSGNIKQNAANGNEQMEYMMGAVRDINEASRSIGKVIKVIDDIAFQTNILALNAAVEAARAGQHGKGFAVVAEEVRNLASKSAEAAKDTSGLIEDSISKAEQGYKIATETAESLNEIIDGIVKSTALINDIAMYTDEQSEAIKQIDVGIEQVAQVVHQNSATSEQSAAASQELSEQSSKLQTLIDRFRIKGGKSKKADVQISMPSLPPTTSNFDKSGYDKY